MASMTGRSSCTNNLLWPFVSKPAALEQFIFVFGLVISTCSPGISHGCLSAGSRGRDRPGRPAGSFNANQACALKGEKCGRRRREIAINANLTKRLRDRFLESNWD